MPAMTQSVTEPLSWATRLALFFGLLTMGMGLTVMFAVVPPLGREAGLSELETGIVLSISALFYAGLTPAWARLADRFGRKPVMVFALVASGVTNLIFAWILHAALAGDIPAGAAVLWSFLAGRLAFGLLAPGLQPAAMAMVADATDARTRAAALGLLTAAMGVGSVMGPALAAGLTPVARVAPIAGAAVLSLVAAVVVIFCVSERMVPRDRAEHAPSLSLFHPSIAPFMALLTIYFVALASFQQTFAFMVEDTLAVDGATAAQKAGIGFMVISIASLSTQFLYVARVKPSPAFMLRVGLALVTIGYGGAALAEPFWATCLSLGLGGVGAALAIPGANALGSLRAPPGLQGSAAGLMAVAPPAGFIVGPIIGALVYKVDPHLPLLSSAVAVFCLFLVSTVMIRRTAPTL